LIDEEERDEVIHARVLVAVLTFIVLLVGAMLSLLSRLRITFGISIVEVLIAWWLVARIRNKQK
jgi:uncharacterized membrane protein